MNERNFPAGADIVEYPEANMVIGLYSKADGTPCAIAYKGRSTKACFHYRFSDPDICARYIAEQVQQATALMKKRAEEKARDAEARRHAGDHVDVGDIFIYSWGWEQTNIGFYEVIKKKGAQTVILQEISSSRTETGLLCGEAMPLPGKYINEPIKKRLTATYGSEPFISMDYGIARKWNGLPAYWSCYA